MKAENSVERLAVTTAEWMVGLKVDKKAVLTADYLAAMLAYI